MSLPSLRQLRTLAEDVVYVVVGMGIIASDRLRGRAGPPTPGPAAARDDRAAP